MTELDKRILKHYCHLIEQGLAPETAEQHCAHRFGVMQLYVHGLVTKPEKNSHLPLYVAAMLALVVILSLLRFVL